MSCPSCVLWSSTAPLVPGKRSCHHQAVVCNRRAKGTHWGESSLNPTHLSTAFTVPPLNDSPVGHLLHLSNLHGVGTHSIQAHTAVPLSSLYVQTLYCAVNLSSLQNCVYACIPSTLSVPPILLPIMQDYLHFVMSKLLCDPPQEEDQHIFGEGRWGDVVLPDGAARTCGCPENCFLTFQWQSRCV